MRSNYSTVADTPEIQRIKATQQNISAVSSHYFFSVASLKFYFVRRAFSPHRLFVALLEFPLSCIVFISLIRISNVLTDYNLL